MRKFGGLGTGKSPMRQRQQPKGSMTSLASLAQMVGQSGQDDYSNIRLCLNSQKPQLQLQESQGYSKQWGNRNQSPLRRVGLNKENDFAHFSNKNAFENNRFADCLIKERPQGLISGNISHSPISGNLFPRNNRDVSPGKLRGNPSKLQQGDLVFRAGGNKGMNFSEISRKFNQQQHHSSNDLLSYAPTLQESRPKSRTKAPKIQKKFDQDHFVDVKESIRQDQFSHKGTMNAGQRQKFESRIEEIKEEKMKMLRNNQGNKTLLPKVIEEIKANATREIEEFAMYLFNQSKEEQQNLLPPQPIRQQRKVIIGAKQPSFIPKSSPSQYLEHPYMPMVQSQYPHQHTYQSKPTIIPKATSASPPTFKLQPQPTRLVRGLQLNNSKENTVIASIKEIGMEFSRKQDEIVMELQRKNSQEQRFVEEKEREKQRERVRQEDLMREMEAKRRKFEEDSRLRQEQASRLEQERIVRQERQRVEYQERIRRQEDERRQQAQRRKYQQLQCQRREEQSLRVEQEERERVETLRKFQEERIQRERRLFQQNELNRMRLERERLQAEERERQTERERERDRELQRQREIDRERQLQLFRIERELRQAEQRRLEGERIEREFREQEETRIRVEMERLRQDTERVQRERLETIERERIESERIESNRIERERIQYQRGEREKADRERLERQRLQDERIQREILEQQRVQEQRRQQQQRLRFQQQRQRLQRQQRFERQRLQAIQDQQRRARVLFQLEQQRIQQEARVQSERLQEQVLQQNQREKLLSAPVNTSFKFDLAGGDLKTSFHFDNMFTNFDLGAPDTNLISGTTPSTLDELTSNDIKQSININSSFKFNF